MMDSLLKSILINQKAPLLMSELKHIARNTIIQAIGKTITIALGLIGFGLVARTLGQEGYGVYATIYGFLAIFGILIDLGLQMTTAKLIADPANNESRVMSNALTIRLVASVIFLAAAPLIAWFFPYSDTIKLGITIAAIGFVFASLVATLTSFFQKNLIIERVAIAEIIAKAVFVGLLYLVLYRHAGVLTIVVITVIESIVTCLLLLYFASRRTLIHLAFDRREWRLIFLATWPIAVTIALNLIYFKGDIVLMSLMQPANAVGLYAAPYRVLEVLINFAYLFLGLLLPTLAKKVATNNRAELTKTIQVAFDLLLIGTIPLLIGGFFVGRPLLVLLAGSAFAVSGDILKILLLATVAIIIAGLFGYVVVALNEQRRMIKFYALNAVVSLIAYLYAISHYSYWGAAWVTVGTELFILLTAGFTMYRRLHFFPSLFVAGKAFVASAVMALMLAVLPPLPVGLTIGSAVLVYFIVLSLIQGFAWRQVVEVIRLK